ncbi:MAG TPA: sarcosine oxidase subunit alpha family protein [Arenibaculum sp.]|nr:sarcosine oxidase subunit alpha family protein [Arenibaculum sp.]
MAGYRLDRGGTRIDRSHPLRFSFDGRSVPALAGDTIASALLACGRVHFGRSFKYHRPRGVLAGGWEEPNALVTIGRGAQTEPNTRATIAEAAEGLAVRSQNAWPSLRFDIGAVNGLLSPFFAAGFYYKTFMGPFRRSWMLYEPFIRRAAGLGAGTFEPDGDRYERKHAFCDVLVVGAGVAGLSAAIEAGRAGKRVTVCDENPRPGGVLDLNDEMIAGQTADEWMFRTLNALKELPNVRMMSRTNVYGYYDGNVLAAIERTARGAHIGGGAPTRQRHWRIQAEAVVLATGALDRPFVFAGNDRPGIMLLSAGLAFARRYGVAVGRDVVVFANNDHGWDGAVALARAGVAVRAIVDPRQEVPARARAYLSESGAEILPGHAVVAAKGKRALAGIRVANFDNRNGRLGVGGREIVCDALLVSAGTVPQIQRASQAGGAPIFDPSIGAFLPGEARERFVAVGALNGTFSGETAAADGASGGAAAAGAAPRRAVSAPDPGARMPTVLFETGKDGKAFVDFQNDVTADDIRLANREGFQSPEHVKRYTTLGMATDQGRNSGLNGLAILAAERDLPIPVIGATRFRPPANPVRLGALVGRDRGAHLQPLRRTPLHDWHIRAGGEMMNVGLWQRPRAYREAGETLEQAYVREAREVRASVGIADVSTLGKIDVQGPDAATFLDRVYTNTFSTLPVGKARYGLMLRDDGFLYDDGTTWRLADNRYLMTTTTANAALVYQNLEMLLAVAWPELRVSLASLTDHWAAAAVSGPNSRALLESAVEDIDMSDAAFPFMGVRAGHISGIPVMLARLSFSGEMAYEVYCGSDHAVAIWNRLLEAGKPFEVVPYGLEALGALRIEKGHVTGAEIDGRTSVHDLGLEKMFSLKKDFVGKPLALRPALTDPNRKQLVGLVSMEGEAILGGAQLVRGSGHAHPGRSEGHATASCLSTAVHGYIALGVLERGRARHGELLYAADPVRGRHSAVEVRDPCMFDPSGSRMHG